MTQTVHKFRLSYQRDVTIDTCLGAKVVHVGLDGTGVPCVWVLLSVDEPRRASMYLGIYGTGGMVSDSRNHVGTFTDGPDVWHVFEGLF